jgi:hypothetical protein
VSQPTTGAASRFTPARYALIPTHNRHTELASCLTNLTWQVDRFVVVDNASDPPVADHRPVLADPDARLVILRDEEQPPNLARLWNLGLDHIEKMATDAGHDAWDVAVLNDDAAVPPAWYDACAAALRAGPAVVASSGPHSPLTSPMLKTAPDRDLMTRMCPHAFVTRGEAGLRADESMRWWWFDSDWDFRARAAGGVALIAGYQVANTCANASTVGALAEQAGRDHETFAAKWGYAPW